MRPASGVDKRFFAPATRFFGVPARQFPKKSVSRLRQKSRPKIRNFALLPRRVSERVPAQFRAPLFHLKKEFCPRKLCRDELPARILEMGLH